MKMCDVYQRVIHGEHKVTSSPDVVIEDGSFSDLTKTNKWTSLSIKQTCTDVTVKIIIISDFADGLRAAK